MISVTLFLLTFAGPLENNPVGAWHSSAKVARAGGVSFGSGVMGCVYLVRNRVNGKGYVGKTMKTMGKRKRSHEKDTRRGSSCYFHNALRKYGFDIFEWRMLIEDDNEEELNESEVACIKMFKTKSPNGYNLTDGGDGATGCFVYEDTIIKIKEARKGYRHSEETKAKISKANKGLRKGSHHSRETKAKISKANKGKHFASLETRMKISNALKGKSFSIEHITNLSKGQKRRYVDPKERIKLSEAHKGKRASTSTKLKMSKSSKRGWMKRKAKSK